MPFAELYKAIESGDSVKAMEIAKGLESDFTETSKEIAAMEAKMKEAIETRDKVREKNRKIAEFFDLEPDELTPDKLDELLEPYEGGGDDSELEKRYQAEIEKVAKKLEETEAEYRQRLEEKERLYNDAVLDKEFLKLGVKANARNEKALEILMSELKKGATIEDGVVVYRDKDGLALRNDKGRPMTVEDKLNAIRNDEQFEFLFKPERQSGGNKPPFSGSGGNFNDNQNLTSTQKIEMGLKQMQ